MPRNALVHRVARRHLARRMVAVALPTRQVVAARATATARLLYETLGRGQAFGLTAMATSLTSWYDSLVLPDSVERVALQLGPALRELIIRMTHVARDLDVLGQQLDALRPKTASPKPRTAAKAPTPRAMAEQATKVAKLLYNARGDDDGLRKMHQTLTDWLDLYFQGGSGIPSDDYEPRFRLHRESIQDLDWEIGEVAGQLQVLARNIRETMPR